MRKRICCSVHSNSINEACLLPVFPFIKSFRISAKFSAVQRLEEIPDFSVLFVGKPCCIAFSNGYVRILSSVSIFFRNYSHIPVCSYIIVSGIILFKFCATMKKRICCHPTNCG